MENAVKALYIAAGVLIGVMILSLGVALFTSLQNYVESSQEQIEFNELNNFNAQFTQYINYENDVKQYKLTIQDIITAAGRAYENNSSYNLDTTQWSDPDSNSLYVAVYLNGTRIDKDIKEKMVNLLEENLGKTYKCTSNDIKYSDKTARVYRIDFFEE